MKDRPRAEWGKTVEGANTGGLRYSFSGPLTAASKNTAAYKSSAPPMSTAAYKNSQRKLMSPPIFILKPKYSAPLLFRQPRLSLPDLPDLSPTWSPTPATTRARPPQIRRDSRRLLPRIVRQPVNILEMGRTCWRREGLGSVPTAKSRGNSQSRRVGRLLAFSLTKQLRKLERKIDRVRRFAINFDRWGIRRGGTGTRRRWFGSDSQNAAY